LKHAFTSLFYSIFVKAEVRKNLAQKARSDFFFAVFENSFMKAVIQGSVAALAAFRLKADSNIILLTKFFSFLRSSLPFMYAL